MKKFQLPYLLGLLLCASICINANAEPLVADAGLPEDASTFLPSFLPEAIKSKVMQSYRYTVEYSRKRQGIVRAFDKTGKQVLEAGFKKHQLDGEWRTPAEAGQFRNGLPHGEWTYYDGDGSVTAVREYDAGKLVAVSRELKYNNPKRIQFKVSRVVHARREDLRTVLTAHNEMAGLEPPFKLALHHGEFINFYPGGQVKDSCAYKEGLRDGMYVGYYADGRMQTHGYYLHGQKHGGWTHYNQHGAIHTMVEYRHGKLIYRKQYNDTNANAAPDAE